MTNPSENNDFDVFLSHETEKQKQIEIARINSEKIEAFMYAELRSQNVPKIIDDIDNVEAQLHNDYYDLIYPSIFEEIENDKKYMHTDIETIKAIADLTCEAEVEAEAMRELQFLRLAGLAIINGQYYESNNIDHDPTESKKKTMADFMIDKGIAIDDPWMQFYASIVPGDDLDPNNINDQKYILEAIELLTVKEDRRKKTDEIVNEIHSIIVNNTEAATLNTKIIEITGNMFRKAYMASELDTLSSANNVTAERDAFIYGSGREIGIDDNTIKKLINLLEQNYPTNK
ncbi:MAG: hypothetical protein JWN75_24 [Candidatus Saccharibacteria bacterium]|nr:hypothetical protein [Candidatus Saccharibacteria bacterium]